MLCKTSLTVSPGTSKKKSQAPRIHAPVAASETRWVYRSRQVTAIKSHLLGYALCFDRIANNSDGRWSKDIATADGFVNQLSSFDFNYWIAVFELVFKSTDALYNVLQSLKLNIGWARSQVDSCVEAITSIKGKADNIYDAVATNNPPPNKRRKIRNRRLDCYVGNTGGDTVLTHKTEQRRVLNMVMDKLLRCLNERFHGLEQLKFLALLDTAKFPEYNKKFPDKLLRELQQAAYGKLFNIGELRSDLMSVYSYSDMPAHLDDLVRHNFETQLHLTLPQFCRLSNLALTLPLTVASAERSFSKLKIVKNRLRNTMGDQRLSSLAIMSLEKEIMDKLKVDDVIDRFAMKKDRRINLIYKK